MRLRIIEEHVRLMFKKNLFFEFILKSLTRNFFYFNLKKNLYFIDNIC